MHRLKSSSDQENGIKKPILFLSARPIVTREYSWYPCYLPRKTNWTITAICWKEPPVPGIFYTDEQVVSLVKESQAKIPTSTGSCYHSRV